MSNLDAIYLDPNVSNFEANDQLYHVEKEARLSVDRDHWLERFSIGAIAGRDAMTIMRECRRAYDLANQGKLADVAVILDNIMKGAADLNLKEAPLYYICTLFINREGEDKRTYDLELAKQKIADWRASGIVADFFKASALNFLSITGAELQTLMQTFSGLMLPKLNIDETPPETD